MNPEKEPSHSIYRELGGDLASQQAHLKLGKGSAFVKSHLRRLPPCDEVWEADFLWAPRWPGFTDTVWHGLVVDDDGILAQQTVEVEPTVNDMADLLAKAMRRPWDETPRRPRTLRIRKRYEWQELLPHLRELVEQVVSAPRLAKWDKAFKEFCRSMAELGSELHPPEVELHYPAIAKWVRENGWIEIGDQEGSGFIVRALDSGGMVLEDRKAKTLAQGLSVLEKGLEKHLGADGLD